MPISGARAWLRLGPVVVCACLALGGQALAGGGGQRLILVVNPADEAQLRIANAYQRLRDVPDANIVFITPRTVQGFHLASEPKTATGFSYVDTYLAPIANHIATRGIEGQIDYIAALGQPFRMTGLSGGSATSISHDYALTYLDSLVAGTTPEAVSSASFPRDEITGTYSIGANEALLHSGDDLYIGTTLAFTGTFGSAPDDAIADLERSAASDGTHPFGTIYFEENDNVRSDTREGQWPSTQAGLTARGIPFIQEFETPGSTPRNRSDVRGAVIGAASYTIPNGSTYLPGCWADSLTSFGCNFYDRFQTKAVELIRAGAGGSSGTVIEPYAISSRFPHSHIFLYSADGSTTAEAFYKSVATPLLQMMLGDPLGQPYADVPAVTITDGPAEDAVVSGMLELTATAALTSSNLATGISRIDLYIDGMWEAMTNANAATFSIDTTALSDGRHDFRLVAVNNAAAASEGYQLRHLQVSNDGRSVVAGGDVAAGAAASVNIPVAAISGSGAVSRIELRHLGRTVGQVSGASGSIDLVLNQLAWGENRVTPVAVFSDGSEVAGQPITVTRTPAYLPGAAPLPPRNRAAGILGEYFVGQGGTSIGASTFSGPPDTTVTHPKLFIGVHDGVDASLTQLGNNTQLGGIEPHPVGSVSNISLVNGLSARYSGRFDVPQAGEFSFFLFNSNDSFRLLIDGQAVLEYSNRSAGITAHFPSAVFLDQGEHVLELLAANTNTGSSDGFFDVALYVRGPDGITRVVDSSFLYQFVSRPDPRVVGYWRHDVAGAVAGGAIGTVVNVASPGTLDAQGINAAAFTANVPGPAIFDPLTDTKKANDFGFNASFSNAQIRILNHSALDVENGGDRSFTVEFFLRIGYEHPGYNAFLRRLFSGPDPDSATSSDRHSWEVDFDHGTGSTFGKARARWDLPGVPPPDYNRTGRGGYLYVDTDGGTGNPDDYTYASGDAATEGDGINDDGTWHHVAVVYDDPARTFTIYTDYQRYDSVALQGTYTHPSANLEYGSFTSAADLLFDEVRYTEGVLDETLFLRASTFSPIEAWRWQHFGYAEGTGDAHPMADPNNDGIVNLIAFAFGLGPFQSAVDQLPKAVGGADSVTFSFDEPPGMGGVVYGAEYSTDLIQWHDIPDTGSGAHHIFTMPKAGMPALFVRLKVTVL